MMMATRATMILQPIFISGGTHPEKSIFRIPSVAVCHTSWATHRKHPFMAYCNPCQSVFILRQKLSGEP